MQVTIDAAGRVVIPKQVRERFGFTAGSSLTLEEVGDHLEIRPVGRQVRIEVVDGRPLARVSGDVPPLTADEVRHLVERERR